ncbi:MAG: hypothetical protein EBS81_04800, partial [Gammaproteobacteria bacterium]|nr:hypothetical protein [Gammaproteobacteria bacterium]
MAGGARSQEAILATNRVLKNTYLLLSMTLLFSAITAGISFVVGIPQGAALILTLVSFGMLFWVHASANSSMGILAIFAFTGCLGASLGPMLNFYVTAISNGPALIMQALGGTADSLTGATFATEFEGKRRVEFIETLVARAGDSIGGPMIVTTKRQNKSVSLYPSLFRAAGDNTLLCRIEVDGTSEVIAAELSEAMAILYQHGADAIVFTDNHGNIKSANDAFLGLCDAARLSD